MRVDVFAAVALVAFGPVQPLYRAETRSVTLQVTVVDARGRLVGDLDQSAFSVFEDGKRQSMTLFSRDDTPVSLALALDSSGSMRSARDAVERAAVALVHASNPQDEVMVVNFADTPHLDVPLTNDRAALQRGIGRADTIGGTALRDAIALAEREIARGRHERKVLVVISDGRDTGSATASDEVVNLAHQYGIVVYAIALPHAADASSGRKELKHIADPTGGRVYVAETLDRTDTIALEIARQIRSQYTIAYAPSNEAVDGQYRRIKVSVAGRLTARTRAGYFATAH